MGEVEYLPATEHDDGIMGVDLSDCENRDNVCASVDSVARYWKKKNKELRVKIPREYFNSLWSLGQMGFNRIERSEEAYIVVRERADEPQIASSDLRRSLLSLRRRSLLLDVVLDGCFREQGEEAWTLTNRSSGPRRALLRRVNIACSSNPYKLTSSQTADATLPVQEGIAFGSFWEQITAGSGDPRVDQDPELQPFPLGPAGMGHDYKAPGLQTKKRPPPANKSERPPRRIRGPDFEDEEKGSLLQVMLEYLQDPANEGKPHKWLMPVTEKMKDKGYDREAPAWRGLWETLIKNHDALMRNFAQGIGYWDLTEVLKQALNKADNDFPLTFEREWVDLMANIWNLKPRWAARKQSRRDGQEGVFSQSLASTITGSDNVAGADYVEETGDKPDSESEGMDVPTEEEVSTFYDDEVSPQIRSYVDQKIQEAHFPLVRALRSREEDEHKHRQKMLAFEKEKLALMRQKLECTRRSIAVPASVAK